MLLAPVHLVALNRPWRPAGRVETHSDVSVLRSRTFFAAAAAGTLVTLAEYASLISLVPLVLARGSSAATAAWVLGLGGAGQVAGRLAYPALSRGLGTRMRVSTISGAVALTIAALAIVPGPAVLLVLLSVLAGAARGLFTLVGATIVSDLWGAARFASLNGAFGAPLAVGSALGPLAGAWIAQMVGGFPICFVVLALAATAGAVLFAAAIPDGATGAHTMPDRDPVVDRLPENS